MDLIIAGSDDSLIDQLSFKLPSTASYGLERRLVSFYPSGASEFAPNGVKVARFVFTGENWLDPASLRCAFKIRNTGNQPLQLVSGSHCLFDQIRVLIGGVEVERVAYYGRAHELFRHLLMPNAWNIETTAEDGQQYDAGVYPQVSPKTIGPGQYLSVNLTMLLGLMNMDKLLPLKYLGGMQIELTLANASEALHPNSASQTFQLEQMQMRASTITLDSALNNSFSELLLQGRALQFHYKTIHLQQQALPANNTEVQVSMVRALSRLAGLFISFTGPPTHTDEFGNQVETPANQRHLHKSFLNPTAFINGAPIGSADEALLQWVVSIGPKNWPEGSPSSNLAETFSLLRQATGIYDESLRTTSITEQGYRLNQFVVGVPLQTIVGQPFSSVNTRSGDLLSIRFTGLSDGPRQCGRIFVYMVAEQIMELRESGVQVMD